MKSIKLFLNSLLLFIMLLPFLSGPGVCPSVNEEIAIEEEVIEEVHEIETAVPQKESVLKIEDKTPPAVISSNPIQGAIDVPKNLEAIKITFSESMNESTITNFNIILYDLGPDKKNERIVHGKLSYDASTFTISFAPKELPSSGNNYELIIYSDVTDTTGNALENDFSLKFRIKNE